MINYLKILWFCKIFHGHQPSKNLYRMVGQLGICKRCRHDIKLMCNGEWALWAKNEN